MYTCTRIEIVGMFSSISDSDGDVEKEKKKTSPPINTIPYTVSSPMWFSNIKIKFQGEATRIFSFGLVKISFN